jgi:hypothetical protein
MLGISLVVPELLLELPPQLPIISKVVLSNNVFCNSVISHPVGLYG